MFETVFGNSAFTACIAVTVYVLSSTMLGFDADDFFNCTKCDAKVGVIDLLCQFFHGSDNPGKIAAVVLKRSIDFIKL